MLNANEYLPKDDIERLTVPIAWRSWLEIAHTWVWIVIALASCIVLPHPLTYFVAVWILGGKQLGCAIIMHDASHYALFRSKRLNIWVGNWLSGYWILNQVDRYRPYHLAHHSHTGHDSDPDLSLTRPYPCSKKSFVRKIARDLLGASGLKAHLGLLAMQLGLIEYTLSSDVVRVPREKITLGSIFMNGVRNLSGPVVVHGLFFVTLWQVGHPWLYGLWWIAAFTTFQLCLRIRSIAEHSMSPDRLDDFVNTRTTYANWMERMLFAPHYVNYHAEHHLLMTAPPYNLPKIHKILFERGYYQRGLLSSGYREILRLGTREVTR